MRKLLLSTALAAGAALAAVASTATPAAAQGYRAHICQQQAEFFVVFCQAFITYARPKANGEGVSFSFSKSYCAPKGALGRGRG